MKINMFRKLPVSVRVENRIYKIKWDFRDILSIEQIIKDKNLSDTQKICKAFEGFYPFFKNKSLQLLNEDRALFQKLFDKMMWFYTCGNRENYHKAKGKGGNRVEVYNFNYDDEYIFSAFYQVYGIDLTQDKLHWWKFQALFKSLPDDCEFSKIMSYRTYKGDDKSLKALKEYWALPESKEEQARLNALYEKLK